MVHTNAYMQVPGSPVSASGSGLSYVTCAIGVTALSGAIALHIYFPQETGLIILLSIIGLLFLGYGLLALKNDREFKKRYREELYRQEQAKADQKEYEAADIVPESDSIQPREETDFSKMEELENDS